jgi:hypothetical protein
MSLQHGLDALRVDFVRAAPPGRAALYDAKKIALAEIELDYRERLEPEAIVAALRSLRSSMTKTA